MTLKLPTTKIGVFLRPQKKFFGERSTAAWLETWSCDFLPNHNSFASESPRSFRLAERPGWLPLLLGRGDFQWSCFWQTFETDLCACLEEFHAMKKVRISEKALVIIVIWMQKRENLEYVSHTLRKTTSWKHHFVPVFMWKHGGNLDVLFVKLTGRSIGTVDGWNPAPAGMYKTE